jgi:hypothetical protein
MSDLARTIDFYTVTLNPVSILPATFVDSAIVELELSIAMFDAVVELAHIFAFSIKGLENAITMH